VVAERGWIEADRLELLTGVALAPTIGRWVTTPAARDRAVADLRRRIDDAGELGLDLSALDERERAVLALLGDEVAVSGGRARPAGTSDPLAEHPFLAALAAGGCQPPDPVGIDRGELRLMVRRGLVVERDGVCFHPSAVDHAARTAARLLAARPGGFTVAEFRDAIGATRKHALPLLNELDGRGVTRRRDDVRIGGPRLPATA
jgi:selenocysteine-specific elongation factor